MCGRFVRKTDVSILADQFGASLETSLDPSFNIAPSLPIAVIMVEGKRRLVSMKWGLIPHWADDPKIAHKLINARAESVASKPSFRGSFRGGKRCLITADGFYEWKKEGKRKVPVYIYSLSEKPFGMAGLYDYWTDPKTGETVATCTIITTEAPGVLQEIHHRMPAVIAPEDQHDWLDPGFMDIARLQLMLRPFPAESMRWREVSNVVNKAGYDSPECIEPPA
jgi:putative SOS response-associated peptidase YedK